MTSFLLKTLFYSTANSFFFSSLQAFCRHQKGFNRAVETAYATTNRCRLRRLFAAVVIWLACLRVSSFSQWDQQIDTTRLLKSAQQACFWATTGTAIYGTGVISLLAGQIVLISSLYGHADSLISSFEYNEPKRKIAFSLLLPGYLLTSIGPLLSVNSEKLIATKGLGLNSKQIELKSNKLYITGLLFQALSLLSNMAAISTSYSAIEVSMITAMIAPLASIAGAYFEANASIYAIELGKKIMIQFDSGGAATAQHQYGSFAVKFSF